MSEGRGWILPLLDGPKPSGADTILAFCPAHPDGVKHGKRDGRSLSYQKSTGLVHCFAGCDGTAIMAAFRDIQVRPRAMRRPERPGGAADGPWTKTAVYDYRNVAGELIAQHVRLESPDPLSIKGHAKRFIWRVSAEDSRTLRQAGLAEDDLPLYGIDRLAADRSAWVNVAEGEKVTDALWMHHQIAVCAGGGASQRSFGVAWEPLRGRNVRIWPDNDPPGIQYAALVKCELKAAGAARVVVMPTIPGNPGTDLADHFARGGAFEELLSGVLEEDAVEFIGGDHVVIRVATEAGEVDFDVAEIAEGGRDLHADLTVSWKVGTAERPYTLHCNLLSPSACESLARTLGKHFHDAGLTWVSIINRAVSHVREALSQIDISDYSEPDPESKPARLLMANPPIPEDGGTVISSPPKRGKSTVAIAVGVTLDAGITDSVFSALHGPRRVLYINLERSKASMLARLARVNVALGLDPRRPLRFIHARGSGLSRILPRVRKVIGDYGIEVVILDSISRGGFGDLNTNQVGNAWIDAMNSLGVTWFAVGHTPRPTQEDDRPHLYGSVMQDAGADVLCSLVSKTGSRPATLLVSIQTTDANDFAKPPTLDLVFEFDEDGLVKIRSAHDDECVDLEAVKTLSAKAKILASIRDEGPGKTTELARRLGKIHSNVARDLKALAAQALVCRNGDQWCLSPGPYQRENDDTYHDTGSSGGHVSSEVSPRRGEPVDTPPRPDTNRDTCSACSRDNIAIVGYQPESTIERELPLCGACADELLGGATGAS